MGTIILDTRAGDVTLTNNKNQQALMMMPSTPVPTIDNIKLTSRQTVKTKGMTCSNLQGGIKWQVELPAHLTNPRGIALDNYGFVYVSGRDSNNVVIISQDGNKHRLLLSEKDADRHNLYLSMSSKLTVCGVCEYRNINKQSVVWCLECDEGLCEECKEHHTASKGSRNHSIVPVSEYQQIPSGILEITQTCPKHSEKYQIFCKKHDCPCCRRCVTETHSGCQEMDVIDDVIKNVKSSNAFLEMEQTLTELSGNLQKIRKDRQENIKSLMECRANIEKDVQQTRMSINKHLDTLQESLTKELYAVEKNESTKIENIISSIQEKERKISESQTTLDKMKQHASDLRHS
ncbi:unnamed protein product [Mytilus edulis]|uniref:B box-type domain-containing protein n=1 Tax=Mytilus edulis TaxID=6550 RepID=A0A8S3U1P0_MYTED|nr:unnamed protein product [Mytilus edulis]